MVISVALIVSWLVAVLFTPLIGVTLLPKTMKGHHETGKGRFFRGFDATLDFCMRWRWLTIGFDPRAPSRWLAVRHGFRAEAVFSQSSDRPELIVDWTLPQNASIANTGAQMARFEKEMLAGEQDIELYSSYVGRGVPRFVLSFDVQPSDVAFGQTVILTKSVEARDRLIGQIPRLAAENLSRNGRLRPSARHRAAGRAAGAIPAQRAGRPGRAQEGARTRQCRGAKSRISATSPSTGANRRGW